MPVIHTPLEGNQTQFSQHDVQWHHIQRLNPCCHREGASKVFQMPLTPAQVAKNASQSTTLRTITISPSDATSGGAHPL